jgi:hypothetical protein
VSRITDMQTSIKAARDHIEMAYQYTCVPDLDAAVQRIEDVRRALEAAIEIYLRGKDETP